MKKHLFIYAVWTIAALVVLAFTMGATYLVREIAPRPVQIVKPR